MEHPLAELQLGVARARPPETPFRGPLCVSFPIPRYESSLPHHAQVIAREQIRGWFRHQHDRGW